jgi:hypothetical protein
MQHIGWLVGYLWFIPVEIIAQIIMYLLVTYLKNKKILLAILLAVAIAGYSYFFALPPVYTPYPQGGYNIYFTNLWSILGYPLRGIGGVFIGYALTHLPKIHKPILKSILAYASFAIVLVVSFWPIFPFKEVILLALFALAIYLLFQIEFSFPLFNYLGAISFGFYVFQTLGSTLRSNQDVTPLVTLLVIIAVSLVSQPQAFAAIFANKKSALAPRQ